jgi:hypothetical protein
MSIPSTTPMSKIKTESTRKGCVRARVCVSVSAYILIDCVSPFFVSWHFFCDRNQPPTKKTGKKTTQLYSHKTAVIPPVSCQNTTVNRLSSHHQKKTAFDEKNTSDSRISPCSSFHVRSLLVPLSFDSFNLFTYHHQHASRITRRQAPKSGGSTIDC